MKKILICVTLLGSSLSFSADDCRPAALEKAKKVGLGIFLEQSGMNLEDISYSLQEASGGFAECCWTRKTLVIKDKTENPKTLAKFYLEAGNRYGEYEKGICESNVSHTEAQVSLNDIEYCQDKAESLSQLVVSRLAKVEPVKSESSLEHIYKVSEEGKNVGTLVLSAIRCKFISFNQ